MKKGIAVPYIIALILGIAVLALIGYWFFVLGGRIPGQLSEIDCRKLLHDYCSTWSVNGYGEKPDNGKDFTDECTRIADPDNVYAAGCCSFQWAQAADADACIALLTGGRT